MPALVTTESLINVLGVVYVHKKTSDGGDIYLTRFGLQVAELLEIENWYESEWFESRRERLEGTSAVYRVPTKEVAGRSIELVVKNCRVGEDIPVETRTLAEFINAEFNSPWEEFALVMEMREGRYGPPDLQIQAQEPLAIYVPPERMQMWQSGRSQAKINQIRARHPGIDLDILRQYKMLYGWIRGKNIVKLCREIGISSDDLLLHLKPLTQKAIADLQKKGYAVLDMKPDHVIIGEEDTEKIAEARESCAQGAQRATAFLKGLLEQGSYSLVDYELLVRTPQHEEEFNWSRRHSYLDDQRDRFKATPLPPHLHATEVYGVPYIWGHAESTGGKLWVVGRNGRLFDYFLPERWRKTHSWKLSESNEVYYTFTKDHIHIVWKTSRVGEKPASPGDSATPARNGVGSFNSPFEEFAIAQFLSANGVPTVYVRAIYMTGIPKVEPSNDLSRYESHRSILDPEGQPVLRQDRNYITVRGYYNGPDVWVAEQRGQLCRPMDLVKALTWGFIKEPEFHRLMDATRSKLKNVGYDGSFLDPDDAIIAIGPDGNPMKDGEGWPEVRICNFEMILKT